MRQRTLASQLCRSGASGLVDSSLKALCRVGWKTPLEGSESYVLINKTSVFSI